MIYSTFDKMGFNLKSGNTHIKYEIYCGICGKQAILSESAIARQFNKGLDKPRCRSCTNKINGKKGAEVFLSKPLEELKEIYAKQGKNRQGKTVTNTTKQKLSKALHSYWKNSTSRQEQSQKLKNYYLNEFQDILEQRFSKVKKSLKEKFSDTSIKKEIVEKQKKTKFEKWGNENYNNCQRAGKKYFYDNHMFDSSFELAFYIYLRDHKASFEVHPNIAFEYLYDGKKHYYYPDFRIGKNFVEVKGSHFKDENGNLCNPYNGNRGIIVAKFECMKNNNVRILFTDKMNFCINYVRNYYGKSFLRNQRRI